MIHSSAYAVGSEAVLLGVGISRMKQRLDEGGCLVKFSCDSFEDRLVGSISYVVPKVSSPGVASVGGRRSADTHGRLYSSFCL